MPIIPRAQKLQFGQQPLAQQINIPAPTGGLNTRDSRSAMDVRDAISMSNLIPEATGVRSRPGYTTFATVASGNVETLIPYEYAGTQLLLSSAGTVLYKSTTSGGSATSIQTGLTNAIFQVAQLGQNMILVNGVDGPYQFDGTTVSTPAYSGDIATPGAGTMDNIHMFKNRMFMWDTDTSDFYYGATSAVAGAFTKFELGSVATTGGNLLIMETISRDGGSGPEDFACFILTTGEVIVYSGNDPGTAANWVLVGKYFISPPVSKRGAARFGGDIVVITRNDVISIGNAIKSGGVSDAGGQGFILSPTKLSGAIAEDYSNYGTNFGWEMQLYGTEGWIITNVPETTNSVYHQFITSTATGASTKFMGWNAQVFAVFNNNLYFGQSSNIFQAATGLDDNGSDIQLRSQQASSDLGVPQKKHFSGYKVFVQAEGEANVGASFAFDYGTPPSPATSKSEVSGAVWDVATWDEAEWAGSSVVRLVDIGLGGVGVTISPLISIDTNGQEMILYDQLYNFTVSNTF